jgi:hypothetical protein
MKIVLPYDWECEDQIADMAITIKAERFISVFNREKTIPLKTRSIYRFFQSYEDAYNRQFASAAMRKRVANRVFEFAVYIGNTKGISRDVIEGLWLKVFGSEIWEFTGKFSASLKSLDI